MSTVEITEGSSSSPKLPNFADQIVQGPLGTAYKGKLPDSNKEVVVLKLKQSEILPEKFKNAIQDIMKLEHENIVVLVGFWDEKQQEIRERFLWYGYVPNKTLQHHLFGAKVTEDSISADPLTKWDISFKIVKGVCQGLLFLHKLGDPIIHMDLNLKNIWLDKTMVPKIANVGLSRIFSETEIKNYTKESHRNMAPEYLNDSTGAKSAQIDIYSLGVMMIQVTTGEESDQNPDDASRKYIDNIRRKWTAEHIASMYSLFDSERLHQVHTCIKTGLECVQIDQKNRPSIDEIVDRLNTI